MRPVLLLLTIGGTLVALCVPLAGAVNWTVVQRSQARGQDIDLLLDTVSNLVD